MLLRLRIAAPAFLFLAFLQTPAQANGFICANNEAEFTGTFRYEERQNENELIVQNLAWSIRLLDKNRSVVYDEKSFQYETLIDTDYEPRTYDGYVRFALEDKESMGLLVPEARIGDESFEARLDVGGLGAKLKNNPRLHCQSVNEPGQSSSELAQNLNVQVKPFQTLVNVRGVVLSGITAKVECVSHARTDGKNDATFFKHILRLNLTLEKNADNTYLVESTKLMVTENEKLLPLHPSLARGRCELKMSVSGTVLATNEQIVDSYMRINLSSQGDVTDEIVRKFFENAISHSSGGRNRAILRWESTTSAQNNTIVKAPRTETLQALIVADLDDLREQIRREWQTGKSRISIDRPELSDCVVHSSAHQAPVPVGSCITTVYVNKSKKQVQSYGVSIALDSDARYVITRLLKEN